MENKLITCNIVAITGLILWITMFIYCVKLVENALQILYAIKVHSVSAIFCCDTPGALMFCTNLYTFLPLYRVFSAENLVENLTLPVYRLWKTSLKLWKTQIAQASVENYPTYPHYFNISSTYNIRYTTL